MSSLPCSRMPSHEVAEARPRRRAGGRQLLVEDDVVDGGQLLAADAFGHDMPKKPASKSDWCQAAWPRQ